MDVRLSAASDPGHQARSNFLSNDPNQVEKRSQKEVREFVGLCTREWHESKKTVFNEKLIRSNNTRHFAYPR